MTPKAEWCVDCGTRSFVCGAYL